MIADAVGVTKAAIYHQFNAKDDIVVAVLEVNLAPLEEALEAAEVGPRTTSTREALLRRIIQQAVKQRSGKHAAERSCAHAPVEHLRAFEVPLVARLFAFIVGSEDGERARARAAALSAAIGSVGHPFVADLTDDVLCDELLALARRIVLLRPWRTR